MEICHTPPEASAQTTSQAQDSSVQTPTRFISLDAETACALKCEKSCKHALTPHTAVITVVGVYYEVEGIPVRRTFRDLAYLEDFLRCIGDYHLVGHNLKFDLRMLRWHGVRIPATHWTDDTQLAAATILHKIPDSWLEKYEKERARRNEDLPRGFAHRKAEKHSLKTLAPFFLGVDPFWENPLDHSSDSYVLLDCEYTYRLHFCLQDYLERDNLGKFYGRLVRWNKMLLDAECRGIQLDMALLEREAAAAKDRADGARRDLDDQWAEAYASYFREEAQEIWKRCEERTQKTHARLKKPTPEKFTQIASRENIKAHAEITALPKTLNLDSPTQLTWLLRDHFKLDIKKFDDDESTGKEVLQRLSASGRDDIGLLLKYRAARKLTSAFFPTYQALSDSEGKLHTSFNPTGTRTGRLSSSRPNLQQVPSDLHRLFIARPGYVLVTRDLAAIEPAVVGYYTDDPILCELLIRGGDFHGRNAMIMFGLDCAEHEVKEAFPDERKLAKTCGLALMYGAMSGRIQATAQQMGWQWTIEKCQDTYDNFQQGYIEVFKFKQELDRGLHRGGCTTNLFGRKHSYPNRRDIYMKGFNTLIQSSASDLLLESTHRATIEMGKENIDAHPLLWVHDEIVFEVLESQAPQAEAILDSHLTRHNLMTRYGRIPLRCEGKTASFWAK